MEVRVLLILADTLAEHMSDTDLLRLLSTSRLTAFSTLRLGVLRRVVVVVPPSVAQADVGSELVKERFSSDAATSIATLKLSLNLESVSNYRTAKHVRDAELIANVFPNLVSIEAKCINFDLAHWSTPRTMVTHLDISGSYFAHSELGSVLPIPFLFPHLTSLNIAETYVRELDPLATMHTLTHLNVSGTPIKSIVPLLGLKNLESLDISSTRQLLSVKGLGGLTNLVSLNYNNGDCKNLTPLVTLDKLETLSIQRTMCQEFAFIRGLASLKSLDVSESYFIDDSTMLELSEHLNNCRQLKSIDVSHTDITDLEFIPNLPITLESFTAKLPKVRDASPLLHLIALKTLCLDHSDIGAISFVTNLHNLESLDVSNTRVNDLSPLVSQSNNLKSLHLTYTPISEHAVDVISNLTELRVLNLSGTDSTNSIGALSTLKKLQDLDVSGCRWLHDASPIWHMRNLEKLNLSRTWISDLWWIPELTRLKWLNVQELRIKSVEEIGKCASLKMLCVGGCWLIGANEDVDWRKIVSTSVQMDF